MNTLQLPIYRAKKLNSEEWIEGDITYEAPFTNDNGLKFVEGYEMFYRDSEPGLSDFIDPSTLSIHFPSMLAEQSNRTFDNDEQDFRIFLALNEDGKGGDIIKIEHTYIDAITLKPMHAYHKAVAIFKNGIARLYSIEYTDQCYPLDVWTKEKILVSIKD